MKAHWMLLGLLILPLTGCSPTRAEAPVQTIGDVSPQMISTARQDMDVLISSTETLKTPDALASRLSDEYRQQMTGASDGSVVRCDGVDFKAFISGDLQWESFGSLNIIRPSSGLPPVRAPAGSTTFPVNFVVFNRKAVIDRWHPDPAHPPDTLEIANTGDVTATTDLWVIGDDHSPIKRQSGVLHFSITYRASDLKIVSFSAPCWYYFAMAGGEEVDPLKAIPGLRHDVPEAPLSREINGYTVTNESGIAYLLAGRFPTAQTLALATDANLRQRAGTISQVAIPIQNHSWRSLQWNSPLKPSIYTSNLLPVPGGLWAVISPFINFQSGQSMVIEGYARNSPLFITTTIPIPDTSIKTWWDKSQDSTWSSDCLLNYYLLGSVAPDSTSTTLVVAPERIVATSFQRVYFYDMDVLSPSGGHPVISASTAEEVVADYDPQIEQNLARFQNAQHHPKPVSRINWFPR